MLHSKKPLFRSISAFLIVLTLFNLIQLDVLADSSIISDKPMPGIVSGSDSVSSYTDGIPVSEIIGEVIEKREKNIKHFQKEDLSFESVVYPIPAHYKVNGKWEDIDNTLAVKKENNNEEILENKSNDVKVKISKSLSSEKLVSIEKENYKISWAIQGINNSESNVTEADISKINTLSKNEKKKTLTKLTSTVTFPGIFTDVDLEYEIRPEGIKENFILHRKVDGFRVTFNINTENLTAKMKNDNSIIFYDKNNPSEEVFNIQAPAMYDSKGQYSTDIEVSFEKSGNGYLMSLIPDNSWLESAEYPVWIDPVVQSSSDPSQIADAHVASYLPDQNFQLSDKVVVGTNTAYSGINRTYLRFTLPSLTAADMVTHSYLHLNQVSPIADTNQLNVHEVFGSWSSGTIKWSNKPDYDSVIADYKLVKATGDYAWDITGITKGWYVNKPNNGLMVKSDNENVNLYSEFYSSDSTGVRPFITVHYVNNSGLENYWTYTTQKVGRAGTAYVNDYDGNFVFIHDDIQMNGNRMPISLSHVFNSNQIYNGGIYAGNEPPDTGYGKGWRLSFNQIVVPYTINGVLYYVYTDGDGTRHYFKDNGQGVIQDESGLNLTLTITGGGSTYTIKDKTDNQMNFIALDATAVRFLKTIKDHNSNTLTLGYLGTKLATVTDGANRVTTLYYNANGILQSIKDPSNRYTTFVYTGESLTRITYPDAKYSQYTYTPSGNMLTATNFDGYQTDISYYGESPYRVEKIQEKNTDGTLGQELNIAYGNHATTFTDYKGKKVTYQFNNRGNTIGIVDGAGYVQNYKYEDNYSTIRNKLSKETTPQRTVTNYLKNHNFETASDWWFESYSGSTGTTSFSTADKFFGNQSLKVEKTNTLGIQCAQQEVIVPKGKTYTLSGYVKTSNVSNSSGKGAYIYVMYPNEVGDYEKSSSWFVRGTGGWQRVELKFEVPENAPTGIIYVKAGIEGETGTAYFDALQLEEGSLANNYNLVENGDFSYGTGTPSFWVKSTQTDSGDTLVPVNSHPNHPQLLDDNAFKFNGNVAKQKNLYQTVKISGKAGDSLAFGGWGKANSVPMAGGASFKITIGIRRADPSHPNGDYQWNEVYFNSRYPDWQYAFDSVVADSDFTEVTIYAVYYNNANTAYFDGLQLYKYGGVNTYEYDTLNGNLAGVGNTANLQTTYKYENNDITSVTDPKGQNPLNPYSSVYEYDNHNLKLSTSAEKVITSYEYDDFGNILSTTTGEESVPQEDPIFIKGTAAYTDNGNYLKSTTDPSGNKVTYNYDLTKGILQNVTDAKNTTTGYTYDSMDRLDGVYKSVDNQVVQNTYGYTNDRLTRITHNGFNYTIDYDSLGNLEKVNVGTQNLVTNKYDKRTGQLDEITYGNGQKIGIVYDQLGRVSAKKYNSEGSDRYIYRYDANGNVGYVYDRTIAKGFRYLYDLAGRLSAVNDSMGNTVSYRYDANSNVDRFTENVNGYSYTTQYGYDKDDRPTETLYNAESSKITYSYTEPDSTVSLGRLTKATVNIGGTDRFTTNYSYDPGVNGSSTTRLLEMNNNGSEIIYDYDENGNIKTITRAGYSIRYFYNELNELKRDDDPFTGRTTLYNYDKGGNITSKEMYLYTTAANPTNHVKTINYQYNDANWKDKLTNYGDKALSYDQIGNLTDDSEYTYTWDGGRKLASMSKKDGTQNISFKYNSEGIRTEKTVDGVTTKYYLAGNKVTYEQTGSDRIHYTYDAYGKLVSMNLNGTEYYYIYNGQSDIIGLFDINGTKVVTYLYDSWGKLESVTGSHASTVGIKNPYRYRAYRYDTETGYYYCQSRYYNPEWGRFINADSNLGNPGELLTHNLFAYCANNPVMYVDPNGDIFMLVTGAIGLVGGAVVGGIIAAKTGKNVWAGIGIGAAAGAAIGLTCGAAAAVIATGTATATTGAVIAGLSAGVATTAGATGAAVYKTLEKGVNFTQTTLQRMQKPNRFVPVQTLIDAIKNGVAKPDPQGTKAIMYTIEMFRNGKAYQLEVLYEKATNTILHFLYK